MVLLLQIMFFQLALQKKWKMTSLHPYIGAVEGEDDTSSNSESDSPSDGKSSVNEDTNVYSSVASYYAVLSHMILTKESKEEIIKNGEKHLK
jgi:hypothetical protein